MLVLLPSACLSSKCTHTASGCGTGRCVLVAILLVGRAELQVRRLHIQVNLCMQGDENRRQQACDSAIINVCGSHAALAKLCAPVKLAG